VETQEALRHRKANGSIPGPGAYEARSPLTVAGGPRDKIMFGLPREAKRCRYKQQFGHMFATMRQRKPSEWATGKDPPGEQPALTEKACLSIYCTFGR